MNCLCSSLGSVFLKIILLSGPLETTGDFSIFLKIKLFNNFANLSELLVILYMICPLYAHHSAFLSTTWSPFVFIPEIQVPCSSFCWFSHHVSSGCSISWFFSLCLLKSSIPSLLPTSFLRIRIWPRYSPFSIHHIVCMPLAMPGRGNAFVKTLTSVLMK